MRTPYQKQELTANPSRVAWLENPVLIQLLGLSPLLAVTTTASKGLAIGLATAVACFISLCIHRLTYGLINYRWRFVWYLFLTATITTLLDLTLQAYWLALHREIGIYAPLIASNFAVLVALEKNNSALLLAEKQNLTMFNSYYCVGIIASVFAFSIVREAVAYGTLFRDWRLLLPGLNIHSSEGDFSSADQLLSFALKPPGAFILLGIFLAAVQALNKKALQRLDNGKKITKVPRARVTGKI